VKGSLTATPAERMRLVVALSETGGTLRHFGWGLVTLLLVSRVGVVAGSSCESEIDMCLARHNFERVWG
jgi:hypothetical protein